MRTKIFIIFGFLTFFVSVCCPMTAFAQEKEGISTREVEATVISISEMSEKDNLYQFEFIAETPYQEIFQIDTRDSFLAGLGYRLKVGDRVQIEVIETETENLAYYKDTVRINGEFWIICIFILIAVGVGFMRGILSVIGLVFTVAILFWFVFPQILNGSDPIFVTVIGSAAILGINMHLAHGFKMQTFRAYLSALLGLVSILAFTYLFVWLAHLTGLCSEDASLLYWDVETVKFPVGILMAGIILGAVGVLDDVAVTQCQVIDELISTNPYISHKELFVRAMRIGRHHIASTVNTLVLVYAGAALPMLLLFLHSSISISDFLNNEVVAEELVRTLAGTCALILTVPISTVLGSIPHKVLDKHHKVA